MNTETTNDDFESIKREAHNKINLSDSSMIASYGSIPDDKGTNELLDLAQASPVTVLAKCLEDIAKMLSGANPNVLKETPGLLSSFTGAHLAKVVRFESANKSVEVLLMDAERVSKNAKELTVGLKRSLETHLQELAWIKAHHAAGREYIEGNPSAGSTQSLLDIGNPRERFEKRLQNLATLIHSKEMHTLQINLVISNAEQIVDRFHQVKDLLVPIWKQRVQTLKYGVNNSVDVINSANRAHADLVDGLAQIINLKTTAVGGSQ